MSAPADVPVGRDPDGKCHDPSMRARWSDARILAAVEWSGRGDLSKIIGAADAINHAVPTIDEVEHVVGLLVPAGLLRLSNDRLS